MILINIFSRYQNKELKATKNSVEELWQLKKDLWDVLKILEKGYEYSASRRKPNISEKCIQKGNIILKAVVADCGDYFLLIHFGKFTRRK